MSREELFSLGLSILILVAVTLLQRSSRLLAAITATMPLSAPLALWIVYAANPNRPDVVQEFTLGLLLGLIPTVVFLIVAYLAARAGWKLLPILVAGYGAWAMGAALLWLLRRILGFT